MFSYFNSPQQKKERIESLQKEIDILIDPYIDTNNGELDYRTLSKNDEAIKKYKALTHQLYLTEGTPVVERIEKKLADTPIHYLWIGPPAQIAGQDIGGPMAMAKVNKSNPITFWCLEEQQSYYADKFKDYKNITVSSVESHIKAKLAPGSTMKTDAEILQDIMDTCLKKEGRGSIRDRVTFKEAFSLFLLQSTGGYVLDSNVLPTSEEKISLGARPTLTVPAIQTPVKHRKDLECWMMYSPKAENKEAKTIFTKFYLLWKQAENLRATLIETKQSLEAYYDLISNIILLPIFEVFKQNMVGVFNTKIGTENNFVDVPELGLHKTYSNTHRFEMRSKYEPGLFGAEGRDKDQVPNEIFFLIRNQNKIQLKAYIEARGDVNDRITKTNSESGVYIGETPLHFAARLKASSEIIKMLLEAGADIELRVKYPTKEYSVRELLLQNKEYASILNTFEESRKRKLDKAA